MAKTSDNSNESEVTAKKNSVTLNSRIANQIFWDIQESEGTIEVDGVRRPYWFGPDYEKGGLAFYIYEDRTHGGLDTMQRFKIDLTVREVG
jgi:hypothetical protein